MEKPVQKPNNPCFSSGPCAKRPGWTIEALSGALIGRSHRATEGKAKLNEVILRHRALLGIPDDYKIAIVPASDTGAIEMAMWSMLGERGVDVMAWENFSGEWLEDITQHLKLDDVRTFKATYGQLPDLAAVDTDRDVVFVWNGTTSGVRIPNADWIKADRKGLTLCDATSAVFAYDLPWDKLDVVTWSWQKVLGSEAAHGMLVLSPRAVARLETYTPPRPLPKIFRMTNKGKLIEGLFAGETLNTPSLLATEDCLDALKWVESIGGVKAIQARVEANFNALSAWVERTPWVESLTPDVAVRSKTSVCLVLTPDWLTALDDSGQQAFIKSMTKLLDKEGVAYDIASYKSAPAGLRIWCGGTVEAADIIALGPWLEWAYETARAQMEKQAA